MDAQTMDPMVLKQLVASQLGRAPTDEEMARITKAMGGLASGQLQPGQTLPDVSPEQAQAAAAQFQGRAGMPAGGDPGTVNYNAGPSWAGGAPGRSGTSPYMTDSPQYDWDGAGPGNYATGPEASRAAMFSAQDAAQPDNVVNKGWQAAQAMQASQPKADPPPYKQLSADIEKKKAFTAGVHAATAGVAKPLPTGGTELAAAQKKGAAEADALQAEADALPTPGPDAAKQVPIGDAPALGEENWNDADPAEKQKKFKAESAKAGKSLTSGELQLILQKQAAEKAKKAPAATQASAPTPTAKPATKPKFDPVTGTFANVPVTSDAAGDSAPATPAAKPSAGPTVPSKAEVEDHLGMTITDAQYKQYLAKQGG